jgi:hypothetical protein
MSSYLFAWLLFLGLALGAMANLMLHNLTGGPWGAVLRPAFVAAARLVPLAALLGIPLLIGMRSLFPIADAGWFEAGFFVARSLVYLALWTMFSLLVCRKASPGLSAAGLIVYTFSMSLAAVDWIASLVPEWYSTGLGLVVVVGQMLGAMALAIAYVGLRTPAGGGGPAFIDLGNLLLMNILTWAYLAFMQFLIIWMGNLPREISWYAPRLQTGWVALAIILVVFHFFAPLAILLSRTAKRVPGVLGSLAAAVLVVHAIDVYWLVAPSVRPAGFQIVLLDPLALLVLGALWWLAWRPRHA